MVKDSSQTVTLTVFDQANGLDRQVEVQVEGPVEVLVPPPQQGVFVNVSRFNTRRGGLPGAMRLAVTYLTYLGGRPLSIAGHRVIAIVTDPVDADGVGDCGEVIGTPLDDWVTDSSDSDLTVFDQANGLDQMQVRCWWSCHPHLLSVCQEAHRWRWCG